MKPSIPCLAASVAALLLALSLVPIWPSGYYLLLTYFVGITAVFMVVRAQEIRSQRWMITWIVIAVLYNPIAPLRLPPSFQQLMNLVCAVLFFSCVRGVRLSPFAPMLARSFHNSTWEPASGRRLATRW